MCLFDLKGVNMPKEPIFKTVLMEEWPRLGLVIRNHYFLRVFVNLTNFINRVLCLN